MTNEDLLRGALWQAAQGVRVLPLRPGTKIPSLPDWQHAATTDAETIATWWGPGGPFEGCNVGVATGPESNAWVLDLDFGHGPQAAESLRALLDAEGEFRPEAVNTTPSGGEHWWFSWPKGDGTWRNIASTVLGAGLDVRGDGGQVAVWPSVVDGVQYGKAEGDLFAPPTWLAERTRKRTEPAATRTVDLDPAALDGAGRYAVRAIRGVLADLDAMTTAQMADPREYRGPAWDTTTFHRARRLVEIALADWSPISLDDARALLAEHAPRDAGFSEADHERIWRSALNGAAPAALSADVASGVTFGTPQSVAASTPPNGAVSPVETVSIAASQVPEVDPFEREVAARARLLAVDAAARERVAVERAGRVVLPPVRRLRDLLAEPDTEAEYLIDRWWPTGGNVVLPAPAKAGKSTLLGNVIRALVDEEPFLGQFATRPATVVLLDLELDERTLRKWLREQGIRRTDRVRVVSLRGRLSTFDLLNPAVRAEWVAELRGADVLIVDPFRPLLDALGLSEDKDAGRALEALDRLKAEAGISELLVAHHMGHGAERSRGDSRLIDWPDASWWLNLQERDDPRSPRFLGAYGRDVDQREGMLRYDEAGRRLTWVGGTRSQSKGAELLDDVLAILRETGEPMSGRTLETAVMSAGDGHSQKDARDAIRNAVAKNRVLTKPGPKRATLHFLPPTPGVFRA